MARHVHIALLAMLAFASLGLAQEEAAYHERLEFDPETSQWLEIAPPLPGTEAGDLALARSLLARGEFKKARAAFETWFGMYPESPILPEAFFYAAETEVSADDAKPRGGDLIRAYEWLEQLLDGRPGTELAERAMRKELIIAEMILFKHRKQRVWGGMLWLSAVEEALDMLARVIDVRAPRTPIAEHALRLKADYHYTSGEFEEAELAYARLMREYPRGRHHKIAMLRSGQSAWARFPGVAFDEADLLEAEVYLKDFESRYPQDAAGQKVPQMLERIADSKAHKEYTIGRFYERTGAIDAAGYYYRWVLDHFSTTTWAIEARNRLIALGAEDVPDLGMDASGVGP